MWLDQGNTKATFIEFKEKPWNLENFHIHIETDEKKEREFKVYPTRAVLEKVKKKLQADPNKAIVAEIHLVFSRTGKNGMKKYIAIGFVAKIGKENEAFKALLNTIGQQKLDRERKLDIVLNYFKMFGAYFKAAEASDLTRLHTWASLKRQDGFYDGLVFNVVLNPIEFSEEQIKQLETLFGELVLLEGKYALEPIDRSANFTITIP